MHRAQDDDESHPLWFLAEMHFVVESADEMWLYCFIYKRK
ncbi:hypothetical protein MIZ03_0712 [Rhodoferax lithotrophicus]|uniref:Uncharacterized protein n=1 Tax=Rhodoferax lithotrophicus TaxID=2798804 RepID=A0ABM7MHZ5_9BURK|nr:hypothetical protein MIZ03_0712 [Rhodoferax sp. MIZ03]